MSLKKRVRAHCIFHGKVQGVFFRANTLTFATSHNVTGWVRNLPNGTVEALFEGTATGVESVIKLCSEEQPYAVVSNAEIEWLEATGEFLDFSVTR